MLPPPPPTLPSARIPFLTAPAYSRSITPPPPFTHYFDVPGVGCRVRSEISSGASGTHSPQPISRLTFVMILGAEGLGAGRGGVAIKAQ